ncbi:hypothetical protein CORC01_09770 [Colletotrichum orchidophilum]|uniref:AB hydrolase-1 domain-containing protein n=1 Tax=Colletotrichum orchidophilum TaxID=1209926 RepID=A0A1G4B0S8_9PEZI|nr:uncharacterized protein CORC01_09770 [Colletotrichum orchidophilum]OHE94976.1 hypothetical protein CORC01_09770 [Colletotrichum orchidophilum]
MQAFKLTLPDGKTVSGLHSIPAPAAAAAAAADNPLRPAHCPLIVGLHGGTFSGTYFDIDDTYSARHISAATGVPFIALDRPGYNDTTPVGDAIPASSSFYEEWGTVLHRTILPALWDEFAVPSGCSAIALHCHSLGAPGACVAAALHAEETSPAYPLAAITISGFGNAVKNYRTEDFTPPDDPPPSHVHFPHHIKDMLMFPPGTADASLLRHTARLDHPMPYRETADLRSKWLAGWRDKFAGRIAAPVLIGLAGRDGLWFSKEEDVREYIAAFTGSRRVEGSVIPGASHNIEMSYWSQGWYARIFGFAMEGAASLAIGDGDGEGEELAGH